ncbi:MAG: hypothetical protein ACQEP1_06820, partial [Nanobdellota archaeon]
MLFLPVSSAYTINEAYGEGEDGKKGYLKGDESVTFHTEIEGEDVKKGEVFLHFPGFGSTFSLNDNFCTSSSCSSGSGPDSVSDCECDVSWVPKDTFEFVARYDDEADGSVEASHLSEVVVDDSSPDILSLGASQEGDEVKIEYEVEDTASSTDGCVGLNKLVVSDDEGIITDGNLSGCSDTGTVSFDYDAEDMNEFTVEVYDEFMHSSSDTVSLETDFTSPSLHSPKIEGRDYVTNSSFEETLQFNITEKNLDYLVANLSSLGYNNDLTKDAGYCSSEGDEHECSFDVEFEGGREEYSFTAKAVDTKGNSEVKDFTITFSLDKSSPEPSFIGSDRIYEGTSYIKPEGNTIKMEIDESGSGLSPENVYLDMESIGHSEKVEADRCEEGWTCYWDDVSAEGVDGNDYWLYRNAASHDDAGNHFAGKDGEIVKMDSDPPEIVNASITAPGELGDRKYFQSGDVLKIRLEVEDENAITSATADLSEVYTEEGESVEGNCEEGICTWESRSIKDGFYTAQIDLSVYDVAGNNDTVSKEIPVYGVMSENP